MENNAKRCCYIDLWKEKGCNRSIHDGKYCIFHSKDIEGKKKDFKDEFRKEFKNQGERKEGYCFSGFVFPEHISFKNKVFEKDAYFGYVQFTKGACFYEAKFEGNVNFWEAKFEGNANFWGAQFKGQAEFGQAQFFRDGYFENTQFNSDVNFRQANFFGKAIFEDITLKYPNLLNIIETYFYDVKELFEYIEDNRKEFKYPDKTEFLSEKIRPILGERAADRYPIISRKIQDEKYLIAFKDRHPNLFCLWWLFADCGRSFKRWSLWCFVIAFIFGAVFAEYPVPNIKPEFLQDVLTWLNPKFQIDPCFRIPTFFTPYYFSIVTFTTLGFGDVTPLNLAGEIWLALEVILGYIMLGGLISILANKLARRS